MGRLYKGVSHETHGVIAMVIGQDEHHISGLGMSALCDADGFGKHAGQQRGFAYAQAE